VVAEVNDQLQFSAMPRMGRYECCRRQSMVSVEAYCLATMLPVVNLPKDGKPRTSLHL